MEAIIAAIIPLLEALASNGYAMYSDIKKQHQDLIDAVERALADAKVALDASQSASLARIVAAQAKLDALKAAATAPTKP